MDSKLLLVIATLALATTMVVFKQQDANDHVAAFENFKTTFGRIYASEEEEAYRFAIYVKNRIMIAEHNAKKLSYWMAENQFTDLSHEEFKGIYLSYKPVEESHATSVHYSETSNGAIDWRTKGAVQEVKDQGQCGSCWAFSAMGSSESASFVLQSNPLENFAEQQLVDCDMFDAGCNGGNMDFAFYHLRNNGICLTSSYPYHARAGTCEESSCTKSTYQETGHKDVTSGSTTSLESALDTQPVSVAVDANNWSFYGGGVFDNCGESLDHGVLLVAYSSTNWTIKNSWGPSWGEQGFIRLAPGNTCGLANQASTPQ